MCVYVLLLLSPFESRVFFFLTLVLHETQKQFPSEGRISHVAGAQRFDRYPHTHTHTQSIEHIPPSFLVPRYRSYITTNSSPHMLMNATALKKSPPTLVYSGLKQKVFLFSFCLPPTIHRDPLSLFTERILYYRESKSSLGPFALVYRIDGRTMVERFLFV